ncbi:beta-lactamase [Dictyocaulus viviparus]|uniref:Beta-lactamase n=1 Tax=Dictyocaulus viviparus TaxID=29172 RepID=A0A0D8Y567_DICVI|nr:beta-lactamase [Dictyocaulus viviparus]
MNFRKNFVEGWERGGAAFAVYHRGKLVVDLWGGYADESCTRRWNDDTITVLFSCTKSVAAICMAMLVDRGLCDYGDKVVQYWPEFGQHGKHDITIEMILSHRAGLPYFEKSLSLADLTDGLRMATIIEEEKPKYQPGTKTVYHVLTFGWLLDQIFCRIDPQHRTIGRFFREEIEEKHHVDVHIGECVADEYRVARLTNINIPLAVREFVYDRKIAVIGSHVMSPRSYFAKGLKNMRQFGKHFTLYNNPETRFAGQPAVNGVGSARGLALVHQLAFDGTLLSKETQMKISEPIFINEYDHSIGEAQNKGHGFIYTRSPTGSWQVGHMGIGGQTVRFDTQNDLVLCYLTNAIKAGAGEHVYTYNRLQRKVYDIISK